MKLDDECRLSFYKQIACLNEERRVYLVQNISDKKIYVKKILKIYNADIFNYLKKHPVKNTPRIYEAVEDSGQLIVIEEYISGRTLQEILDEQKNLKEDRVKDIICQLCLILNDLNNAKPPIIHRDIKPSNIIISPDGVVKLIDMNAAKWVRSNIGRDTTLIGTVGYAAPEQYGFASSGIQTDIYSVGVLMNIMLTGVLPTERLAYGNWSKIISNCTKMEPQQRYNNFDQVIAAINRIRNKADDAPPTAKCPYAPPGFRSLKPIPIILSSFVYILVTLPAVLLPYDEYSVAAAWTFKIIYLITFLAIIFFLGNYLGIQDKIGVCNTRNKLLGIAIKLFLAFNILVLGILLTAFANQFIK